MKKSATFQPSANYFVITRNSKQEPPAARLDEVANGDGDLRLRLDDSAKDEMADLARAFNVFTEKLSLTIKNVSTSAHELGQSS